MAHNATASIASCRRPNTPANPDGWTATEFFNESFRTLELFARGTALDGRLRYGGNIFYSDYDDFQLITVIGFTPVPSAVVDIDNIDVAFAYGLEAEVEFDMTDYLSVFANIGLLETELEEINFDGEVETREFGTAPPVSAFFGVNITPTDNLRVSAQFRYADRFESDTRADPDEAIDDIFIANLNASYRLGSAEVYAYVDNLFDEFFVTNVSNGGQFAFP